MINFYMMVGLPGSGKSHYAECFAKFQCSKTEIFSSDAIRAELYGNEIIQENPAKVFATLHYRVKQSLRQGVNCIYDATNISGKRRKNFLKELKNIPCKKICIFIATPVEECKKRNNSRARHVPENVIDRMANQFDPPSAFEGWDEIKVISSSSFRNYYGSAEDFLVDYENFNQENNHHSLTLGEHCQKAYEYIHNKDEVKDKLLLEYVAKLHDCGKIATKFFKEGDPCAHYYGHHNRGAYDSFFFEKPPELATSSLEIAFYIRNHMEPYFWENSSSLKEKEKNLWGEQIYENIVLLHEADEAAH